MSTPSIAQLKQAVAIAEQIEKLQAELGGLVGGSSSVASVPTASTASPKSKRGGKRKMSPATILKMKAAQQARWAKKNVTILDVLAPLDTPTKSTKGKAAKATKKKGGLTPEGRAKLAAAMKARWAARKKGAPALNAPAKSAPTAKAKGKAWYAK